MREAPRFLGRVEIARWPAPPFNVADAAAFAPDRIPALEKAQLERWSDGTLRDPFSDLWMTEAFVREDVSRAIDTVYEHRRLRAQERRV